MKRTKMIFGAFLILCFMVAPALAGTTYVNHGTAGGGGNYAIAHEVLGTSRTVMLSNAALNATINNPANTTLGFIMGQNLTSGSLLSVQLDSSLNFRTVAYDVCAQNAATGTTLWVGNSLSIGRATPGSGATNFNFVLNNSVQYAGVSAGNSLYLTTSGCSAGNSNVDFTVVANAPVGTKLITASILLAGTNVDPSAGANAIRVANEFTSTLSANDLIYIDYLSTPYDGTHFTQITGAGNLIAMSTNKLVANNAATMDFRTNDPLAVNGTVTLGQVITLADSANWQGVSKVFLMGQTGPGATLTAQNCLSGNVIANNTSPSGTITLTAAGNGAFNGSTGAGITLCVQATGSNQLGSRTLSGNYAYTASSGGLAPSGDATGKIFQIWIPNGYQAFQPYMYVGSSDADDVFVRLYNNSDRSALAYADVYPADGTASQTISLGTISANTAGLYWARTIGASAGYAAGTSYAARFTVTAPQDKVNGVSFMKRSTGGERAMPLYKGELPGQYLYQ